MCRADINSQDTTIPLWRNRYLFKTRVYAKYDLQTDKPKSKIILIQHIEPIPNVRIGVATTHGVSYYRFSTFLKSMNVHFDPILPKDIYRYEGDMIFTTILESPKESTVPLLYEDVFDYHPTVIRGMMIQRLEPDFEEEELIIGIDPGKLIGLSASYYGHEIESSFYSSMEDLVGHIIEILGGLRARQKIVRIGDGDMTTARTISKMLNLKFCSSYHLEFVDERRTSPRIKNYNRRGKRDMLAAKFISQRKGHRYAILPTSITG